MAVLDEIGARLVAQGVGTLWTSTNAAGNIFKSSAAIIPTGDGPYLTLRETGGTGSAKTQNDTGTQRPTVQLLARAKSYVAARTMLKAAYAALGGENGLYNVTISSVFYISIVARQEPTDIGLGADGRAMVAFNIDAEKYPS